MYQNLYNLKLKMAKVLACANSLNTLHEERHNSLNQEQQRKLNKNINARFINLLVYWGVVALLLFVKTVTAIPETAYDVLYFSNIIGFMSYFGYNLMSSFKIKEKYDDEIMETLFSMMRVTTMMFAFHNSLESKHSKMYDELSDEEKKEYNEFLKEHQEELDKEAEMQYDLDEVQIMILEMVHESDNNMSDERQEYEQATKEYIDNVTILMADYLLEEKAAEIREKELEEDEDVKKKTL